MKTLLTCLFILFPALAFAQDGPLADGLSVFLGNVVFPLLAAALATGLLLLAAKLGKQFPVIGQLLNSAVHALLVYRNKIATDQQLSQAALYELLAQEAVAMVEERAAATVKAGGEKLPSSGKFGMAVDALLRAAPELSQDRARQLVDTAVAWVNGTGATEATVK